MSGGYYAGKGKSKGGGGKGSDGGGKAAAPAAAGGAAAGAGSGGRMPGDDIPAGLSRKLSALSYPELDSACLSGQAYCKMILWLEEEKIRLYEKIDRKGLRDFNKGWYTNVSDYCKELGVNAEGLGEKALGPKLRVLNGLTNLAVQDIYCDKAEANEFTLVAPNKPIDADLSKQRLANIVPPVNRLLSCFGLPELPAEASDSDTVAALRCIRGRVCQPAQTNSDTPIDIDSLPIGMHISDTQVKRAAAVLRLLHGIELQQLQGSINNVINDLQRLTADPRTDARLGRVGR